MLTVTSFSPTTHYVPASTQPRLHGMANAYANPQFGRVPQKVRDFGNKAFHVVSTPFVKKKREAASQQFTNWVVEKTGLKAKYHKAVFWTASTALILGSHIPIMQQYTAKVIDRTLNGIDTFDEYQALEANGCADCEFTTQTDPNTGEEQIIITKAPKKGGKKTKAK